MNRHIKAALARSAALSPERRSEIASQAAKARWSGEPKKVRQRGSHGGPREMPLCRKTANRLDRFRLELDGMWDRAMRQRHYEIADAMVSAMEAIDKAAGKLRSLSR